MKLNRDKLNIQTFVHPGNPNWIVEGTEVDGVKYIWFGYKPMQDFGFKQRWIEFFWSENNSGIGELTREFPVLKVSYTDYDGREKTQNFYTALYTYAQFNSYSSWNNLQLFQDWLFTDVFPNIGAKSPKSKKPSQTFRIHTFESKDVKPIRTVSIDGIAWFFAMDIVNAFDEKKRLTQRLLNTVEERHKQKMNFNYLHAAVREAWIVDAKGAEQILAEIEATYGGYYKKNGYLVKAGHWWRIVCDLHNEFAPAIINDYLSSRPKLWKDQFEKQLFDLRTEAENKRRLELEKQIQDERLSKEKEIADLKSQWAQERDQQLQSQMLTIMKMFEAQSRKIDSLTDIVAANQKQSQTSDSAALFDDLATFFKSRGKY